MLSDLVSVAEIHQDERNFAAGSMVKSTTARDQEKDEPSILSKNDILKQYPMSEKDEQHVDWPFMFRVKFVERVFTLAARSMREMREWVRIFHLIIDMNRAGLKI